MLRHRSEVVQLEISGDHHQWLLTVRGLQGERRTFTFSDYGELIAAVLEELALIWSREGKV